MSEDPAAFLAAARDGDLAALRLLHGKSAWPRALCAACRTGGVSSSGHSALHWLAAGGHEEAAKWLISCEGTDVNAVNNGGSTPLHSAAANGHASLCRLLLEHGVRAGVPDANGLTAFDVAAARGHAAAARELPPSPASHVYLRLSVASAEGDLIVKLDDAAAPRACANFVGLAEGFKGLSYRGSRFHRLLPGQIIQGGVLRGCSPETPKSIFGGAFADERGGLSKPQDRRGLLCLANSGVDSNGSQFYLTLAPCTHLNGRHVVFGELIAGDDLLQLAASVPTTDAGKPSQPVLITDSGRWPPSERAAHADEAPAAAPAVTLEQVAATTSSTTSSVASAMAQGLKRAGCESAGDDVDGARAKAARPAPKVAMWDALLVPGGDGDDDDDDSDSDEEAAACSSGRR